MVQITNKSWCIVAYIAAEKPVAEIKNELKLKNYIVQNNYNR